MNDRPKFMQAASVIDLAREADFSIGRIEVRPSRRQIVIDGREEAVQPRVMQVFVALARARGAVVSRKDLIDGCWGGAAVSKDSINQSMAKMRRIAELGGREFDVETIPRVGYKLKGILPGAHDSSDISTLDRTPAVASRDSNRAEFPVPKRFAWNWKTIVLAASLAIAGAAIVWFGWPTWFAAPRPAPQWTIVRSEVPIATSLVERYPSISPDGSMIAYSAGTDFLSRKIYLQRASGGNPLRLTNDPYDDSSPSWSPDGSQIVYAASKPGEPCRLMITPSLAGSPREVTRCRAAERSHVLWSTSGKELFFIEPTVSNGNNRIVRFDIATGLRRELAPPSPGIYDENEPAVSPDGRWIAFCRDFKNGDSRQILLDLHSGAERSWSCRQYGQVYGIAFSPDSKNLFVTTKRGDDYAIWAWPINGQSPIRILSSPEPLERLSFSSSGLLAVEIARWQDGVARPPAPGSDKPTFLESENGKAFTPDVSLDGSVTVSLRQPNGAGIWIFPKSGGSHQIFPLEADDAADAEPRWSPDGKSIAITSQKPPAAGIRIISMSGSVVASIPFHGRHLGAPTWEAGGRSLIFPGFDKNIWRLWRVDLDDHNRISALPYVGWTSVRARGSELYGERSDTDGVWRIDGNPRKITPLPEAANAGQWTIAGNEIAYVDVDSDQGLILGQPIQSGKPHTLARIPDCSCDTGIGWDSTSHSPVYVAGLSLDADIELLHLENH
jgi:Tol biopolymer transport system component/DNA-binding winged helix-turn-helix (wHTH) protein